MLALTYKSFALVLSFKETEIASNVGRFLHTFEQTQ